MAKITIIEHNANDKDNVRTYFLKGEKGETGDTGNGIQSIEKTATSGNVDTYTITFTNGSTFTYQVANGDGATVIIDDLVHTDTDKALSANQGKVLNDSISGKVNTSDIIDDLTHTDTNKPLSANQGKALNTALGNKVNTSDIVDNLTSTDTNKPLSANQGKVLNTAIGNKINTSDIIDNLTSTATNKPLSAKQGKVLNDALSGKQDTLTEGTGIDILNNVISATMGIINGNYTGDGTDRPQITISTLGTKSIKLLIIIGNGAFGIAIPDNKSSAFDGTDYESSPIRINDTGFRLEYSTLLNEDTATYYYIAFVD